MSSGMKEGGVVGGAAWPQIWLHPGCGTASLRSPGVCSFPAKCFSSLL